MARNLARLLPALDPRDDSCRASRACSPFAERRDQAREGRAKHNQPHPERNHHAVDMDGFNASHLVPRGYNPLNHRDRQQKANRSASRREHEALHQMLPQETQSAAAQRRANRLFLASRRCARHQQIGHVEACNQQQAARRCQQARKVASSHRPPAK